MSNHVQRSRRQHLNLQLFMLDNRRMQAKPETPCDNHRIQDELRSSSHFYFVFCFCRRPLTRQSVSCEVFLCKATFDHQIRCTTIRALMSKPPRYSARVNNQIFEDKQTPMSKPSTKQCQSQQSTRRVAPI